MMVKSAVAKDIEVIDSKARLDAACKKILANKSILAWIMKSCLEEFSSCTIKDITEKYIEGEPEISEVAVHRDEVVTEKIFGTDTEDKTLSEGTVTYDVMFTAIVPETKKEIRLYVNIEAQNDFYPGYPLIKRGIYYCCRMISVQYEKEFTDSHYENLKKVCSIWICINPPKNRENSITQYTIQERVIAGNSIEEKQNYDLINCIMLCLGDPDDTDGILRLLNVLLSTELKVENKKTILEQDYNIAMTKNMEREATQMCNYSDGVERKGFLKGIAEGRAEGRAEGIAEGVEKGRDKLLESLRLMGVDEETLQKAVEQAKKGDANV